MKEFLKYDTRNKVIEQFKFDPHLTPKSESMMAQGNGYLGLRAVDEEVDSCNKEDLFVRGVFNRDTQEDVPELVNLADCIQTPIYIDGMRLSVRMRDKYSKSIDFTDAVLTRSLRFIRNAKTFEARFERFVSFANSNVYCQRIKVRLIEGGQASVDFLPRINGQTTNYGTQHKAEGHKFRPTDHSIRYLEKTNNSRIEVFHNMVITATKGGVPVETGTDEYVVTMDRRRVGFRIANTITEGEEIVIDKLMSVNTTVDTADNRQDEHEFLKKGDQLHTLLLQSNYDRLKAQSKTAYDELLKPYDLKILGDSAGAADDRLAMAFTLFHLAGFMPRDSANVSVAAKGLSGEGYQGHTFWDTEIFVLPNYFFIDSQVARNLLEYRYRGLHGARAKAAEVKLRPEESNIQGAQFPWEAADPADGEVCPYWGQADIITGKQEPVASRRQEIHVSADVAFAVQQYYECTEDQDFMDSMGYEIIIDTACFWARRAERTSDGRFAYNDVMGPNEYKGNINNNAFINSMARHNLLLAIKHIGSLKSTEHGKQKLQTIYARIPYDVDESFLREVADKLIIQHPNSEGIIAENDSFLHLRRNDISKFKLTGDAGKKLFSTKAGTALLGGQLIKQADVVLMTYLFFNDYSQDVIEKNFDFYEQVTTHDSSLSPVTHMLQAVSLRKMDVASKLFKYALGIDMGPNMKSCDKGIHAGAIASNWQCVVFGYGGVRLYDGKLHLNPILPKDWEGLDFCIDFKGRNLEIKISRNSFFVRTKKGDDLEVFINGKSRIIKRNSQSFEVAKGSIAYLS